MVAAKDVHLFALVESLVCIAVKMIYYHQKYIVLILSFFLFLSASMSEELKTYAHILQGAFLFNDLKVAEIH